VSAIDADPELVIPPGAVLPEKPTFFLVHGFNDFGEASWLLDLKDAILSKVKRTHFLPVGLDMMKNSAIALNALASGITDFSALREILEV